MPFFMFVYQLRVLRKILVLSTNKDVIKYVYKIISQPIHSSTHQFEYQSI